MTFLGLSKEDKNSLKYEVIPSQVRLKVIRLIRNYCMNENPSIQVINQNKFINIERNIKNQKIYVLTADRDGEYSIYDYAWHSSYIENLSTSLDTIPYIELVADFIENRLLNHSEINHILESENCSFWYDYDEEVVVKIKPFSENSQRRLADETVNIRTMIDRMEKQLSGNDYPGVVHSSAVIFETLGKEVIGTEYVKNKTFGQIREDYKKMTNLPDPIFDYLNEIYKKRNNEPLAGHGSTDTSSMTREEAIVICEMTKAILLMERALNVSVIR